MRIEVDEHLAVIYKQKKIKNMILPSVVQSDVYPERSGSGEERSQKDGLVLRLLQHTLEEHARSACWDS